MSDTGEQVIFDPAFLERLRSLFFQLRSRRQLRRQGAQPTPATGFTREFKDHRPYTRGDDYREVDWNLYARLDRLFIRLFEEVQEFHVHVLLDVSRSMAELIPAKRVAALRLAAAMSYLGLVNQHRVSLMSVGESVTRELPPLKGQGHIHDLLRHLTDMRFDQAAGIDQALRRFRPASDRRGVVFIISDLFGESLDGTVEAVAHTGHWPAETHVVQVIDPQEMSPGIEGELQLVDVETQEARRMWLTRRDIERYTQAFEAFQERLRQTCASRGVNYLAWPTDMRFEDALLKLLARGSALTDG